MRFVLRCVGSTHALMTPLDLVKCRLQVDSAKYKNLIHGFRVTLSEEGARGLAKGWAPTLLGYSAQVTYVKNIYIYICGLLSVLSLHKTQPSKAESSDRQNNVTCGDLELYVYIQDSGMFG